jgi:hypothetical protein
MASDIGIRSNDRGATVHSDVLTGHVARSVRGEIDRRTLQVGVIACAEKPRRSWLMGKQCPILSGAISWNQDLECPYLGEILDAVAQLLVIKSGT